MKKGINIFISIIIFFLGCLCCYIALQIELFKINYEVKICDLLLSAITATIGLYIAITIQKKFTKSQNKYHYLETKFDSLWSLFNAFSDTFAYDSKIELSTLTKFNKEFTTSIEFLKSIYSSYEMNNIKIIELGNQVENLEILILNNPKSNNIIEFGLNNSIINSQLIKINQAFSNVLKEIHEH